MLIVLILPIELQSAEFVVVVVAWTEICRSSWREVNTLYRQDGPRARQIDVAFAMHLDNITCFNLLFDLM